jgi:hypothetical protein
MKRLRLGTGEVVHVSCRPKPFRRLSRPFGLSPPLGADAVDFVLGAEAVPRRCGGCSDEDDLFSKGYICPKGVAVMPASLSESRELEIAARWV